MADLSYWLRDARGNSLNDYEATKPVANVLDFLTSGVDTLAKRKKASSAWEAPLVSENTNQRNYGDFIESLSGVSPGETPIPRISRNLDTNRMLASTMENPTQQAAPAAANQSPEQAIMAKLQGMQASQVGAQKDALKKLEAEMEAYKAEGGETNLAPLTSLVDSWTGSNFTGSYKQPMSREDRQLKEFALQDMLQKQRRGIADDEMGLLKLQLAEKLGVAKAAKGAGGARLPASAVKDYTEAEDAVQMASGLEGIILGNAKLMGPAKGLGALSPYSEEQKKLVAQFDLIRQKIGKAIEGGVLRKEDESKYMKILPVITDLPEVAIDKAKRLTILLGSGLSRYMDNYGKAGYDVGNFKKSGAPAAPAGNNELSEAMQWLQENPDDPRAAAVREKLGV